MKIAIITDSTCDWPVEDYAARDVTMVPLRICFGAQSFLDQREIASEEFYDRMIGASDLPSTSQPSPGDFAREFERLAAEGYEEPCACTSPARYPARSSLSKSRRRTRPFLSRWSIRA